MRFTGKRVAAVLVLVGVSLGCRRVRELELYCDPGATRVEEGKCFDGEQCCGNVCISSSLSCVDGGAIDAGLDGGADAGVDGGNASADAGFAVFALSPNNNKKATSAAIGVDDQGRVVVVWAQGTDTSDQDSIWARRYVPDAGWTDAGVVSLVPADPPQLAVGANGAGVVAWLQNAQVYARRLGVDGVFSSPVTVEALVPYDAGSAKNMRVATDRFGNAVIVWERDDRVYWNAAVDGGGWNAGGEVSDDVDASAVAPFVALHPWTGEVWVAFLREINSLRSVFVRRTTLAASGWGQNAIRVDREPNANANSPRLGADERGNVIAIWDQAPLGSTARIWSNRLTPAVGWGDAGHFSDGTDQNSSAELAVDGDGGAVAVWLMDAGVIKWSRLNAGTATPWAAPIVLGTPTALGSGAHVAVARNGLGAVVWLERSGPSLKVRLARLTAGVVAAPSDIVSAVDDALSPVVAVDPSGNGRLHVVWPSSNGTAPYSIYYYSQ